MTDWEDVFAMAAGHDVDQPPVEGSETVQETENETSDPTLSRKRKKPTRSDDFSQMLASRMSSSRRTTWPSWIRLGSLHTTNSVCSGWKESSPNERPSERYQKRSCRHCNRSPLHHRVQLKVGTSCRDSFFPLSMFCAIRNIRCCASIICSSIDENHSSFAKAITNEFRFLRNLLIKLAKSTVPTGEGTILEEKCTKLIESASYVLNQIKPTKHDTTWNNHSLLENSVRLIIGCDAVYYRLYYLQIAKCLPISKINGCSSYLPHPTQYFLTPYLSWDIILGSRQVKQYIHGLFGNRFNESKRRASKFASILERYGLDESSRPTRESEDPLSALHHNRLLETTSLFHATGFKSSIHIHEATLRALKIKCSSDNNLGCHETPAPKILMDWRDSCRDILCNLYAYAALIPGTARRIRDLLNDHRVTGGLVELGAGTGYISRLLKDAGVHVKAFDVHPTTPNGPANEYHGCTPPFFNVREGSIGELKRHLQNGIQSAKNLGLLLCYPPPQSLMARNALQTYVEAGGRCLVHIGEFCGLTGSAEFEGLLTENFQCLERIPCLSWGTDAADVTFWIRTDTNCTVDLHAPSHLLLACSCCGKRSAVKRCRLVRFLVYCGQECFLAHRSVREMGLAISMVALRETPLDYDNEDHFVDLKSFDTGAQSDVGIQSAVRRGRDSHTSGTYHKRRKKRRKKNRQ